MSPTPIWRLPVGPTTSRRAKAAGSRSADPTNVLSARIGADSDGTSDFDGAPAKLHSSVAGPKLSATDLNLLVVLDALLETKSATRAAKLLSLSQPATSHALARLRTLFDDPLFLRTPRGLTPTPRAEALRPQLRLALDAIKQTLDAAPSFDPATARRVYEVCAEDYASSTLVPSLVAHLAKAAPNVDIFLRLPPDDVRAALEAGALDLAFGSARKGAQVVGIQSEMLYEERFVCLLRREHPLGRKPLTFDRFCTLGHVLVTPQSTSRTSFLDELLAQRGRSRRVAVAVSHFLVAPMVVAQSDLVLTVAERLGRRAARELGLRVAPVPLDIFPFDIVMQWHPRHTHDPGHSFLREAMRVASHKA